MNYFSLLTVTLLESLELIDTDQECFICYTDVRNRIQNVL